MVLARQSFLLNRAGKLADCKKLPGIRVTERPAYTLKHRKLEEIKKNPNHLPSTSLHYEYQNRAEVNLIKLTYYVHFSHFHFTNSSG